MEAAGDTGGLENRLRGLILNNSVRDVATGDVPVGLQNQDGVSAGGTVGVQQQQQNVSTLEPGFPTKGPRKRLNQAQRRQMSAQLSIPIDTRTQPPPSAKSYASPPAYQQHHAAGSQSDSYRQQRSHSATFAQNQPHNIPNPPLTGVPFSQTRHHQPQSVNGPLSSPGFEHDWRQFRQQTGNARLNHMPQHDGPSPRNSIYANETLYQPGRQIQLPSPEELKMQSGYLERLCINIVANAEIETSDILEKENFRAKIELACREVIARHEREQNEAQQFPPESVSLKCFGSLSSGFATKAADMDLGLLSPLSRLPPDAPESPIPRLVEKTFLELGLGARLLTRTRVPIIKVCENPPEQLRLDLLEEREKWEKGVTEDPEDPDEEAANELPSPVEEVCYSNPKRQVGMKETSPSEFQEIRPREAREISPGEAQETQTKSPGDNEKIAKASVSRRLSELKQGNRTLQKYFNAAKKLLKAVGGYDMKMSNYSVMTVADFRLLNRVCLAFVDGLKDAVLRERLLSYRSLSRYELEESPERNQRSLYGVMQQVEGEETAMLWESRQLREMDSTREEIGSRLVRQWRDLQNRSHFGSDPLQFNKDLQVAKERLMRIPSIHVCLLSQNQFESASSYHSRAIKLLLDLGSHDTPSDTDPVLGMVIRQYISGIYHEKTRHEVRIFLDSQEKPTLRAVARRHKSLQLADEFERALEKGLYHPEYVPAIRAYIESLRLPLQRSPTWVESHFDYVVPEPAVISEIRKLSDPSQLSPNQPRDPYKDRLDFPKAGVGVQCDINFSAHLALQNTLLLRCYSLTDPRVRPMVLFVKHWAQVRGINTPYRGTLSSYGYVLMVLHYLVNVAQPFVCPNLQELAPPTPPHLTAEQFEETVECKGRDVRFWRDEDDIRRLAHQNTLTQNRDPIGYLLRGFFEYYAQNNFMTTVQNTRGFDWGRDVLSLRTHGGIKNKQEKGWTGAKTVVEVKTMAAPPGDPLQSPSATGSGQSHTTREVKEVRNRYLFAIEDPFELDHNVARTVTHNGIVSIRDEFRRAWRIIKGIGKDQGNSSWHTREDLLEDITEAEKKKEREQFGQLLNELHGYTV